jgi:hypothetical protein
MRLLFGGLNEVAETRTPLNFSPDNSKYAELERRTLRNWPMWTMVKHAEGNSFWFLDKLQFILTCNFSIKHPQGVGMPEVCRSPNWRQGRICRGLRHRYWFLLLHKFVTLCSHRSRQSLFLCNIGRAASGDYLGRHKIRRLRLLSREEILSLRLGSPEICNFIAWVLLKKLFCTIRFLNIYRTHHTFFHSLK